MDNIIKIVESLEKSNLIIDCVTETVKYEIKKQENGFLGAMMAPLVASLITPMASSLIQPMDSTLMNALFEKEVMRTRNGQKCGILLLVALPLMIKALEKGARRSERGYNHINKSF